MYSWYTIAHNADSNRYEFICIETLVLSNESIRVMDVDSYNCLVLTEDGRVFEFDGDYKYKICQEYEQLPKITSMSHFRASILFADINGHLHLFKHKKIYNRFIKLDNRQISFNCIVANTDIVFASEGELYVSRSGESTSQISCLPNSLIITKITFGENTLVVVSANGSIYYIGVDQDKYTLQHTIVTDYNFAPPQSIKSARKN